jgi:hypothetical protein
MSELMFVVKSLMMSVVLVATLQIRVGGRSIESQIERSLKTSETALWFQGAAAGGAIAIRNFYHFAGDTISEKLGSAEDEFDHQSASR